MKLNFNSEQKIYDYVGEFLIKQGRQSLNEEMKCVYRGPNGTKCAIGCLMSDYYYRKSMEGTTIFLMSNVYKIPKFMKKFKDFLFDLQYLHDDYENWNLNGLDVKKLIEFGKNHNLDTSKFSLT